MTSHSTAEGVSEKEHPVRKIDVRAAYALLIRAYLRHKHARPEYPWKAAR
jgi:hypothetical protein